MSARSLRAAAVAIAGACALWTAAAPAHAWPAEATRELAVREGPGMEYPHITVIQPGTVVDIRHCSVERTWCKVDAEGVVGYLRGAYLQRLGDVYLGPRVDLYAGYRGPGVGVYIGPPPRPYYRDYYYDGPRHRRW